MRDPSDMRTSDITDWFRGPALEALLIVLGTVLLARDLYILVRPPTTTTTSAP